MAEHESVPDSRAGRILALALPGAVGAGLLAALFAVSLRLVEPVDAAPVADKPLPVSASGAPGLAPQPGRAHADAVRQSVPPGPSPSRATPAGIGLAELESRLEAARAGREFAFLPMKMTPTRASRTLAAELAAALAGQPGGWRLRVRVHAHTWGSRERNAAVAVQRAAILRELLLAAGMHEERLRVEGVGDAEPVADLWTPEGRRRGRRIEITIEESGHGPDRNLAFAG